MTSLGLSRYALTIGAAAALLVGCNASQPLIGAPGAAKQESVLAKRGTSANYKVLHSFQGKPNDGAFPHASLVAVHGTLYGTTVLGGADAAGAVFSITSNGDEQLLHSFTKAPDGSHPFASLADVHGTLYGTTIGGGGRERGMIFSVTTAGVEQIVHRFLQKGDRGGHPAAALINVGGTLYGTTEVGGQYLNGTVFSVTTGGVLTVLHSFDGASGEGWYPVAPLVDVDGTLYGTTKYGGTYKGGTVFSITTSGTETVLYNFGNGTDGKNPEAGLIDVDGTLYGTTVSGGTYGAGTVFSITASGAESVLHSFGSGTDGAGPAAGLINVGGTVYGTTVNGGTGGFGTVYSIGASGAEAVVYDFTGGAAGQHPDAGLLNVGGVLYGTTTYGGSSRNCSNDGGGCGTVFALTP